MSDSLCSVWGHSVHFAKFPVLRFSEGYCSHSCHPILTKLYGKYGNQEYRLMLPHIKKKYDTLKFLFTHDHMGLEIQNITPTFFIRSQPNFMRTLTTMMEYQLFLAIGLR